MLEWMNDPDVVKYMRIGLKKHSIEEIYHFIKESQSYEKNIHYAISDSSNEYYGTISLKEIDLENKSAEYAIALHPSAIGTGVAQSATREIFRIAENDLKLKKLYLCVLKENERARKFYQKNGWNIEKESNIIWNNKVEKMIWYTHIFNTNKAC